MPRTKTTRQPKVGDIIRIAPLPKPIKVGRKTLTVLANNLFRIGADGPYIHASELFSTMSFSDARRLRKELVVRGHVSHAACKRYSNPIIKKSQ